MKPSAKVRQMAFAIGTAAVLGSAMLGACASKDTMKDMPAESTPRSSAPAPVAPTEKAVNPSPRPGGENSFAPSVKAKPAPTALPGNVISGG